LLFVPPLPKIHIGNAKERALQSKIGYRKLFRRSYWLTVLQCSNGRGYLESICDRLEEEAEEISTKDLDADPWQALKQYLEGSASRIGGMALADVHQDDPRIGLDAWSKEMLLSAMRLISLIFSR